MGVFLSKLLPADWERCSYYWDHDKTQKSDQVLVFVVCKGISFQLQGLLLDQNISLEGIHSFLFSVETQTEILFPSSLWKMWKSACLCFLQQILPACATTTGYSISSCYFSCHKPTYIFKRSVNI